MTAILRIIMISLIGGLLTACGGAAGSAGGAPTPVVGAMASPTMTGMLSLPGVPIPTADPALALLRYYYHGGFCLIPDHPLGGAECKGAMTINRDGRLRIDSLEGLAKETTITAADLQTLIDQIVAMDLDVMRATPFTDTCPTAYDSAEVIVTFFMPTGPEVLASCTVVMDFTQPPLSTIKGLLERYGR